MEQTEKTKEEGLKVWKRWNTYQLRGHKHIGKQIMKKYGLVQKDIDEMRRELINRYRRNRRKKIKEKKEMEGDTK